MQISKKIEESIKKSISKIYGNSESTFITILGI